MNHYRSPLLTVLAISTCILASCSTNTPTQTTSTLSPLQQKQHISKDIYLDQTGFALRPIDVEHIHNVMWEKQPQAQVKAIKTVLPNFTYVTVIIPQKNRIPLSQSYEMTETLGNWSLTGRWVDLKLLADGSMKGALHESMETL